MYSKVNLLSIHTYTLSFRLFSRVDHYRVLSGDPYAAQQVLISYFIYRNVFIRLSFLTTNFGPLVPGRMFSVLWSGLWDAPAAHAVHL